MRIAVSVLRIDHDTHCAYFGCMEHISHIWPTIRSLADDLGTPYTTVHSWYVRGRIPPDRDLDLIEAAKRRGATLTLEQLARARRAQTQEGAA